MELCHPPFISGLSWVRLEGLSQLLKGDRHSHLQLKGNDPTQGDRGSTWRILPSYYVIDGRGDRSRPPKDRAMFPFPNGRPPWRL